MTDAGDVGVVFRGVDEVGLGPEGCDHPKDVADRFLPGMERGSDAPGGTFE